jgi:hypothetical protein
MAAKSKSNGHADEAALVEQMRAAISRIGRAKVEALKDADGNQVEIEGLPLYVRGMTGAERDKLEAEISRAGEGEAARGGWRGRLAVALLCTESGTRIFDYSQVAELNDKDSAFLDLIAEAGMRFNKFGTSGIEAAEKNSSGGQSESSTSDSPSASIEQLTNF